MPINVRGLVLPLVIVAAGSGLVAADPRSADNGQLGNIEVGTRKQLLVDDNVLSARQHVTREPAQVIQANGGKPVLVADQPWENADLFRFGSVVHDGAKFRMWYQMNDELFGYAESDDGLNWTKPHLGLVAWRDSTANNIVDSRCASCFLDPHETDPEHRYKSAYGHPQKIMVCLAHSPDGLHWTSYNNGDPVTHRAADTMNQLLWDEDAGTYRLHTRTDFGKGRYAGTLNENRGTREMINPDVKGDPTGWKIMHEWHFDREGPWEFKRRQVYSLNSWNYSGVRFGMLWCYEWAGDLREGGYDIQRRHEQDVMNYYLVATRGNTMWDLSPVYAETPLVPRGPDGSFDKDWVQPAGNIATWQDRHWIYYCGSRERHDIYRVREGQSRWQCAIGLATLRLDGFASLAAGATPGLVMTKPFALKGRRLEVNADARDGEVVVELLDAAGRPLTGFSRESAVPMRGEDGVRLEARWQPPADLNAVQGRQVRLRFHLTNARLYAFQFR